MPDLATLGRIRPLRRLYHFLQHSLGLSELKQRLETLELEVKRLQGLDVGKERWIRATPDSDLTCGRPLDGNAFIAKVSQYGGFGPEKRVLEVGPGYGRLLASVLARKAPFWKYVGLDISEKNIEFLRRKFVHPAVSFEVGDAEFVSLEDYDTLMSSMTFKHFFPNFRKALANLVQFASPSAVLIFDLVKHEGFESRQYLEKGGDTFLRRYSKEEVESIIKSVGLKSVEFDVVDHGKGFKRLLVVARTSGPA